MGITAVIAHVAAGAALGAVAGASALRRHETKVAALAFTGFGAVAISLFMVLQFAFWSASSADTYATFAPDFLSPGRGDRILWWYALAAAGAGSVLAAAWVRIRTSRR